MKQTLTLLAVLLLAAGSSLSATEKKSNVLFILADGSRPPISFNNAAK